MADRKQLKTDTLAGGIALLLALTVVQRLVGFARGVLFCRWLDAGELGQWDLAYGFLMLAAPMAVLGLPGSLGRYAEHYRQRAQIKAFLRRMAGATTLLAVLAVAVVAVARGWFSEFLFHRRDQAAIVGVLAVVLATWILHSVLVALFNALRMTRVVAIVQFCHSLAFALVGCGLLLASEASAANVLWSFALASVASSGLALTWLAKSWNRLPCDEGLNQNRWPMWRQVLPFAFWVWTTNALANLFGLADRWMLIHFSGLAEPEALAQLGQYHSARVIPLLFLALGEMLAGIAMPHLAHDWEAGRRADVSYRLNFMLKLFALGLFAASVVLLAASPVLFGVLLVGKYAAGSALLPWTLMYCIWGALAVVATSYLWCAERARLASFSLVAGLVINVTLAALLLPRYGLAGAVWATSCANFAMLAVLYVACWLCGLRCDRGVCLCTLAPLALLGGTSTACSLLVLLTALAVSSGSIFTSDERRELAIAARRLIEGRRRQPVPTPPPSAIRSAK